MPEVREAQAQLAQEAGIGGFCYYHYWFGNGKQELELPFNEVLRFGKPNFSFVCVGLMKHGTPNFGIRMVPFKEVSHRTEI